MDVDLRFGITKQNDGAEKRKVINKLKSSRGLRYSRAGPWASSASLSQQRLMPSSSSNKGLGLCSVAEDGWLLVGQTALLGLHSDLGPTIMRARAEALQR